MPLIPPSPGLEQLRNQAKDLLRAYPGLTGEDIAAALHYAAEAVREAPLLPFAS